MFLDGRLYYERKEQDPFRFDLKLPKSMKLSTSNLSDFLESTTSNSIDISKLVVHQLKVTLPESTQGHSKWKKFCVDTCYGYWSPTAYLESKDGEDCLTEQLCKKKGNRSTYYKQLFQYVKSHGDAVFSALNNIVNDIGENAKKEEGYGDIETWVFLEEGKLKATWQDWLANLNMKMGNERFRDRLNSGVSSVTVPDIWEDAESTREFENSFFESVINDLLYILSASLSQYRPLLLSLLQVYSSV